MFNRKKLDREKLEIYLAYLLLAYRLHIIICGLFLLVGSVTMLANFLIYGGLIALVSAYLLLLGYSYPAVLFTARLLAWIGMLGRRG